MAAKRITPKKKTTTRRTVRMKSRSWVDVLHGSARFSEAELVGDDRLRAMVEGARTKPAHKSAKRA
ncbi:MAG: hypothetical protein WAT74_10135 [Flavobacteriales bacterium]